MPASRKNRDQPWLMRTYSGHSSARASNTLYRTNLAKGQTGLSVAFDLPTQTGYDADSPLARGEVGKVGAPISHIEDMDQLFDQIPLDQMNTSMTINATAAWLLSLYIGLADALCSDHTPVDDDAKQVPFAEAEPGTTGLELLLPLTLAWAREMRLPLKVALARITADAARVLGLNAGHLRVGGAADVCIFDPEAPVRISRESLRSQGKNTPYLARELPGRVSATLVSGQVVYEAPARH